MDLLARKLYLTLHKINCRMRNFKIIISGQSYHYIEPTIWSYLKRD